MSEVKLVTVGIYGRERTLLAPTTRVYLFLDIYKGMFFMGDDYGHFVLESRTRREIGSALSAKF